MARTKEKSLKRAVMKVPQSLDGAATFLVLIGAARRKIEQVENELNTEVEHLKNQAAKKVEPLADEMRELFEGLYAYAESHRSELTDGGKIKTVSVMSGDFGWRMTPQAVSIRNTEKVLEELHSKGFLSFIRTKEEINKEAMLELPSVATTVKGVKIGQYELFFAKPSNIAEVTAPTDRLKKVVG